MSKLSKWLNRALSKEEQALKLAQHYRSLMERHLADSQRYQALLFHSWKCIREQAKGLRRQAAKIKRLKEKSP